MSATKMKKFWVNPLCTSFSSQVRSVRSDEGQLAVVLEETCFYPEGGGQPADRGKLAGLTVLDVQEKGDEIIHILAEDEAAHDLLRPGSSVAGEIDRPYRLQNMRLHTTCHVLFGAARLVFESVHYAGFNIGESGSLYLKTERLIRPEDLREMTRLANQAVVDQHNIRTWLIDPADMDSIPGLAVNLRELPDGPMRIVDIEGWDIGACCGTHLPTTLEIGPIKAFHREFHKKNITRIDYLTGRPAVDLMAAEERILGETAEFMGCARGDVYQMTEKLSSDLRASQTEGKRLREKLMDLRLEQLTHEGQLIGDATLFQESFEFLDTAGTRAAVSRFLEGRSKSLAIIIGGNSPLALAVGCTEDLGVDLRPGIMEIVKRFNGGGGGKPTLVSAGNIRASAEELKTELLKGLFPLVHD
jgi:alanyl-tRNA synthetase